MGISPTVPTMVWGGQVRLIARALGMDVETMWRVLYQEKKEETA